jgi:hypothetical protein
MHAALWRPASTGQLIGKPPALLWSDRPDLTSCPPRGLVVQESDERLMFEGPNEAVERLVHFLPARQLRHVIELARDVGLRVVDLYGFT